MLPRRARFRAWKFGSACARPWRLFRFGVQTLQPAVPQIREDTDAEQLPRGTRVTLHLKEDAAEYADDGRLGALIKQYSECIAIPIKLWAKRWAATGPAPASASLWLTLKLYLDTLCRTLLM